MYRETIFDTNVCTDKIGGLSALWGGQQSIGRQVIDSAAPAVLHRYPPTHPHSFRLRPDWEVGVADIGVVRCETARRTRTSSWTRCFW